MRRLPFSAAHTLSEGPAGSPWLIEGLWSDEAVGVIGGEPKSCKSFLGLELAVAVASGKPCLRRFPVIRPGRVLLFNGEDALHVIRERLEHIAAAAGEELYALDIQVITAPVIRLDSQEDQRALAATVEDLQPRLLLLDPLVRMHSRDENAVQEVSPLLAYLRGLQRRYRMAVVVVHHFRKGAGRTRQGQALRGSSEIHSWGDSALYLRRTGDALTLTVEHRAAPSMDPVGLKLRREAPTALELDELPPDATSSRLEESLEERILQVLVERASPVSAEDLRRACRVRRGDFWTALRHLSDVGRIHRHRGGYTTPPRSPSPRTPRPDRDRDRGPDTTLATRLS